MNLAFPTISSFDGIAGQPVWLGPRSAVSAYLAIADEFLTRGVNDEFSGGEQKRMETMQLAILRPKVAILDELDSGLDVDALRDIARRVRPERAALFGCGSGAAIRTEIARVVPAYAGIEDLHQTGDTIQVGGAHLCAGGVFPLPGGRAQFAVVKPTGHDIPEGRFLLSTRRGKQFNSMVWAEKDPLTGAGRDALFLADADAASLGVAEGDAVLVRSAHGVLRAREA